MKHMLCAQSYVSYEDICEKCLHEREKRDKPKDLQQKMNK